MNHDDGHFDLVNGRRWSITGGIGLFICILMIFSGSHLAVVGIAFGIYCFMMTVAGLLKLYIGFAKKTKVKPDSSKTLSPKIGASIIIIILIILLISPAFFI